MGLETALRRRGSRTDLGIAFGQEIFRPKYLKAGITLRYGGGVKVGSEPCLWSVQDNRLDKALWSGFQFGR